MNETMGTKRSVPTKDEQKLIASIEVKADHLETEKEEVAKKR